MGQDIYKISLEHLVESEGCTQEKIKQKKKKKSKMMGTRQRDTGAN